MREYLSSFDLFKDMPQEGENYINECFGRLMHTMEMIPHDMPEGSSVLELGANPYFLTVLLQKLRKFKVTPANYFGSLCLPTEGKQTISSERYGESHEFAFKHFNIETEMFPYKDASFSAVFFCEILEHLVMDPSFVLSEINRCLKPGGHLIISTPNVCRITNLHRIYKGQNIYDPYSGHGFYGRHNREYTVTEVNHLVTAHGFNGLRLETHNSSAKIRGLSSIFLKFEELIKANRANRGEYIIGLFQKTEETKPQYPEEFYRSMYSYKNAYDIKNSST